MRRYEVQDVRRVLDSFWSVDEATVRYERPDRQMSPPVKRLALERGDAVAAIVFHRDTGRYLFVRQFRYPTARHGEPFLLEAVAGGIDDGETPEDAIRREIEEEIGFQPQEVRKLAEFFGSPGGLSEMVHVFYVEVTEAERVHEGNALEGEDVELVSLSGEQVQELLAAGEIRDAKAQLGLLWLQRLNLLHITAN